MLFVAGHFERPASRVVITGAGVATPLGCDWDSNSEGFRTGRVAFRPIRLFDACRQRVKSAAEVDLPGDVPIGYLGRRQVSRLDRASKLLLVAGFQAWRQAGWSATGSLPVVLGTTSGGMSLGQDFLRQALQTPHVHRHQAARAIHYQSQRQGLDLADALQFKGQILVIANACASGANALGHAWDLLRRGRADRVLAGGYDALSHLVFSGFDSLQSLSPTRCRPFDVARDGLSLGEGAAVFALETLSRARSRGATILGEIAGYGAATDPHHLTQPHPAGDSALQAMRMACAAAGVAPEQIGYLNAHGTGTPLNDSAEVEAINRWAGDHAPHLWASSTKSGIGHLLGGAGAVEAAVCLMALQGQWLPPSTTLERPDPAARFKLVREPTRASFVFALSNSFGFGGANATLILRRWT